MTSDENFTVLTEATARLADPAKWLADAELMSADQSTRPHLDSLIREFVDTQKHDPEFEERLWLTLHTYLQQLDSAYTLAQQEMASPEDAELAGKLLQHRMDTLGLIALCHYLRYQPLPSHFWLELHAVYQMAERVKLNNIIGTSCDASYLQALMLGTVNRSNILKWEIVLVNDWLKAWCKDLSLDRDYDETQHLFFVDLLQDRGARLLREFMPSPTYRYWHLGNLAAALEGMRQQLNNNLLPAGFSKKTTIANAQGLVEQLLAEWSPADYRRQRRGENREGVSKSAQVVHGIFNVCQHVKNLAFSSSSTDGNKDGDLTELLEFDTMQTDSQENNWEIENESTFGFGAVANSKLNPWLKPGRLIALDYQFNPDMTVVGVVRSIQQQFEDNCYVGIEVLSHTPSYVLLVYLGNDEIDAVKKDAEPFSAIYLAKDEAQGQAATLVMPIFQYLQSGFYQLKIQQRVYLVRLTNVIELRDDWLRTGLEIVEKVTSPTS